MHVECIMLKFKGLIEERILRYERKGGEGVREEEKWEGGRGLKMERL